MLGATRSPSLTDRRRHLSMTDSRRRRRSASRSHSPTLRASPRASRAAEAKQGRSAMSVYTWSTPSMGGRLTIAISAAAESSDDALADAAVCGRRVNAWANRLTRFREESDLSRLNAADTGRMTVRPTLGAILGWARTASDRTGGIVDSTLLDARLAAETGHATRTSETAWQIERHGRTHVVDREPGTRFDLDGLAKGWLADRAADLLSSWPGVAVDADGDIALRADVDVEWLIDIADPRPSDATGG